MQQRCADKLDVISAFKAEVQISKHWRNISVLLSMSVQHVRNMF